MLNKFNDFLSVLGVDWFVDWDTHVIFGGLIIAERFHEISNSKIRINHNKALSRGPITDIG